MHVYKNYMYNVYDIHVHVLYMLALALVQPIV